MNWKVAEKMIRHSIIAGTKLENRTVLEGPDFKCWGYDNNGTPGFKIEIGKTTCIEVPLITESMKTMSLRIDTKDH